MRRSAPGSPAHALARLRAYGHSVAEHSLGIRWQEAAATVPLVMACSSIMIHSRICAASRARHCAPPGPGEPARMAFGAFGAPGVGIACSACTAAPNDQRQKRARQEQRPVVTQIGGEGGIHDADNYVALLRGINVGGKNKLPMGDLAEFFRDAGCGDVRTYIQSGGHFHREPDCEATLPAPALPQALRIASALRRR